MTKHSENTEPSNSTKPVLTTVFLTPYLPYNLKGIVYYTETDTEIIKLSTKDGLNNEVSIHNWFTGYTCKPILRPIIDLEKLVYNEFEKFNNNEKHDKRIIDLFCEEKTGFSDELTELENFNDFPYETVVFMFEYHYDFFRLIEKGLAISIHDVK